ncbi:uncharacterized protein LOC129884200 [Solanum dulcamara]|uniref:uncharacterized protein LOC129884200 n=1 Tax=Solanum dulcamara TaxID=45834 RepID=UPI0024867E6C|nr:uncharacterized protein LOC129884200 [Solanum dulcamara]
MNSARFPILVEMARDTLAVPVSSIASESAFNTGGCLLDSFRSSLTPNLVQALVCLQDWFRRELEKNVLSQEKKDEQKVVDAIWEFSYLCNLFFCYYAIVRMPSAEFGRIYKDLSSIGDTVVILVTNEGVKFSIRGDIGTANIVCKKNTIVYKPEEATVINMNEPVSLTFENCLI